MPTYNLASGNGNASRIVKPTKVLMDRLSRESASSKLLDGLNILNYPKPRIEGVDDMPALWPLELIDEEEAHFGAKTGNLQSTNQLRIECTLHLMLSFPREHGLYSTNYGQKPFGYIDWVERVKDSMELDDSGNADLMLENTCIEPMYTRIRESSITDLAWVILFEVEYYPIPTQRGTRHYGWEVIS